MSGASHSIGIDEVGRGPLAGPVAVGVACVPIHFDWTNLPDVTDSKKLSAKRRVVIYEQANRLKTAGLLDFEVVAVSAYRIDRHGISAAITEALTTALTRIARRQALTPADVFIRLDGGLKAPASYEQQETIIKGDGSELVIGLASIVAKVTRDQYMEAVAKQSAYKDYGFAAHKGYGTKLHQEAIITHGLSPEHRVSFCQKLLLRAADRQKKSVEKRAIRSKIKAGRN